MSGETSKRKRTGSGGSSPGRGSRPGASPDQKDQKGQQARQGQKAQPGQQARQTQQGVPTGQERLRVYVVAAACLVGALVSGYVLTGAAFPHGVHRLGSAPLQVVAAGGGAGVGPWEWVERLAPGVGLLVAVATCAALTSLASAAGTGGPAVRGVRIPLGGRAAGWSVALVGVLGILGLEPVRFNATTAGAYAGAQVGLAVAAGVLLGAAAQAARRRRWAMQSLVGGAVAACFMSYPAAASWALDAVSGGVAANLGAGSAPAAWWWPPVVAAVLAAGALILENARHGAAPAPARKAPRRKRAARKAHAERDSGADRMSVGGITAPPAAFRGVALVVLVAGGYGLLALAGGAGAGSASWVRVGSALVLTIVLFAVCGSVLGAGGMILPASLAVTVVAEPLVAEAGDTVLLGAPVIIAVVVLALAAAAVGYRWPSPGLGFVLLFLVGLLGVLTFGDSQTLLVFRLLVGAVGGAYLLSSALAVRAGRIPAVRQTPADRGPNGTHDSDAKGTHDSGAKNAHKSGAQRDAAVSAACEPAGAGLGAGLEAWHTVLVVAAVFVASAPAALAYRVAGASNGVGGGAGLLPDGGASVGVGAAMTLSVVGCAAAYTSAILAGRVRRSR